MKKAILFLLGSMTACPLLLASAALAAQKIENYSAEMVSYEPGEKTGEKTRISVSGKKMRIDPPVTDGESSFSMILRNDKNIQWIIDKENNICMEQPMTAGKAPEALMGHTPAPQDKIEVLGTESVSGYKTTKKKITSTTRIQGVQIVSSTTIWEADEFPLPIRTVDEDGSKQELENIKVGTQPDALFEIPSGCQQIKGNGHMLGIPPKD